ncbi:methyltransferase domain-containing protein [Planomonospora sp. ID82291]|uniref:methyltransferase domain-containing protein n=1 Tax=Planomonospora sp. ID82291 TaxID=2738136 RepID=UPI0018C428D5|nr:methyltransferase domain-containing protein [Planomonospora sp. ID82291]MBG0818365.1 methyltransferase domain-containing protein [Planomonospora sp. ID82291]
MSVDLYPPRHRDGVRALADYLTASGVLGPCTPSGRVWVRALQDVPRHLFVPARAWAQPMDERPEHLIDHTADPAAWWEAIYSNTSIITQRGDGTADVADLTAPATSSLSCPHVAAEMLCLLDLDNHHRVLEIGTGTGWSAAMLSWRLRDDQVVTVEIDQQVAEQAAANLAAAGCKPTLIVGDGALGHPGAAPYDRVHVTCGVRDIPPAWIEQTRPGGVIVAPWMPAHGQWGEQVRLDVLGDGHAIGRFRGGATFMMLRAQRPPHRWPTYPADGAVLTDRLDPRTIAASWGQGFGLYLAGAAPHLLITSTGWEQLPDWGWAWIMRLRDLHGSGWAIATTGPSQDDIEITQDSEQPLWSQLRAAFLAWLRAGRPGRDRIGLTITPEGRRMWLDVPGQQVPLLA